MIDEFNCSPDTKGFEGRTVIHHACNSGNVELVEMLLTKCNLDPLSVDDDGDTPLHIAALAGREEVANMLINKYNCPVDCRNNSKQTPLHFACGRWPPQCCQNASVSAQSRLLMLVIEDNDMLQFK